MSPVAVPVRMIELLELEVCERRSHNRYPIRLELEYKLLNQRRIERLGNGWTVSPL